jgi:pimeloyl-ACP methyl ester carboxylesterase
VTQTSQRPARPAPPSAIDGLRGASRLAVEATLGVAELVEAMQLEIGGGPRVLGRPFLPVARLLSAPVHAGIGAVTRLVGRGVELALDAAALLGGARATIDADTARAVLNGVIGDHLAATGNPLAIEMALRRQGERLELERGALGARFPGAPRKLLVFVHGSCRHDRPRCAPGQDGLSAIARELGFARVDLLYNTGLHVSANGRAFAALLERLVASWPGTLDELAIVGHSMGGLVARSAAHAAEVEGHAWRGKLRTLVCIASPHHGAPLERAGSWVDALLGVSRYSAPFARLGRIRSAGVTDLRFGSVLDEHDDPRGRFASRRDVRRRLCLPPDVRCYAIAATRTAGSGGRRCASDGVVPVESALGRHVRPELTLAFDDTWIGFGMGHVEVLERPETHAVLRRWLSPTNGRATRSRAPAPPARA